MGFTSDDDSGDGRLPDITAVITNIGIDYREYDNGNDEHRLVVTWEPDGDVFGTQTATLSTYSILKIVPEASVIHVGGEENGFDLEILGHVIEEGKLGYKAAVWMKKLEELGVKIPSESGNLHELIGVKAVLHQMTFNETKGREKLEREKPFWMPIEIVSTSKGIHAGVSETKADEVEDDLSETLELSLHDAVLEEASGKAEKELIEWFLNSVYSGEDKSVVPLFVVISGLVNDGVLKVQNGIYVRYISTKKGGEGQ